MAETWVWSLGWKDPLEEGMTTHSGILAWRIPWTEEPGGLQSMGSQRVGRDWEVRGIQEWGLHYQWELWVKKVTLPQHFLLSQDDMKHAWLWTWGVFSWLQIKLELIRPRDPDTYSVVQYLVQPGLGQQWPFKEEDESPWACPTPLSKGSKNVSSSFFFCSHTLASKTLHSIFLFQ